MRHQGPIASSLPHAPLGPSDLPSRALADVAPADFDRQRVNVMTGTAGRGPPARRTCTAARGTPHVLDVFTASRTVNTPTGRIPLAPANFPPILRTRIDPFLVAVKDDSPSCTLGDLLEAAHARLSEVTVSGLTPSTHPHNRDRHQ